MEIDKVLSYLNGITPREYQLEIFNVCKEKNCLVVLPTGLGKTLIALMLAVGRMIDHPMKKIVFLAPTRPLAEQHLNYFKKNLPELFAEMNLFTGKTEAEKRKELWQNAEIIFSTPQCIANDVKNNLYDLKEVSLLIEDECHRCMKNYSYTYVAKKYREQAENQRILGMTASPGHEKENIKKICDTLAIEAVEIRSRQSEDVKDYLQELKFETIKLDFPEELNNIRALLKSISDKKIEELKSRKLLFGIPNKKTLLDLQHRIMKVITHDKNFNMLMGASLCAQALKIQHAIELIETQTLYSLEEYLKDIFEQANKKTSKAVQRLINHPEFNQAYTLLVHLNSKKIEHPKLIKLKEIIEEEIKNNPKMKAIVFAQYRDTVTKIAKELNTIQGINASVFVGQAKKSKTDSGLTQKEQQEIIRKFSAGEINIICSTSIGEEGLDIPEVSAVVFYEPIPSAIRQIQRRGRTARLQEGKLITLVTKGTRDESYYWSAFHKEKKMYKAIEGIKKDIEEKYENSEQTKLV